MRMLAVAALILLAPQAWAASEYWEGDNYLECLVGKGIVELRHGATVDEATDAVGDICEAALEPPAPIPPGTPEWGEYVDHVYGTARRILRAAYEMDIF